MTNSVFHGEFGGWLDVAREYTGNTYGKNCDRNALAAFPEPDEVLYAVYDLNGYDGSAFVAYRNSDTYYTLEGRHCSCNQLKDDFDPDSHTLKEFKRILNRYAKDGYGVFADGAKAILAMKPEFAK